MRYIFSLLMCYTLACFPLQAQQYIFEYYPVKQVKMPRFLDPRTVEFSFEKNVVPDSTGILEEQLAFGVLTCNIYLDNGQVIQKRIASEVTDISTEATYRLSSSEAGLSYQNFRSAPWNHIEYRIDYTVLGEKQETQLFTLYNHYKVSISEYKLSIDKLYMYHEEPNKVFVTVKSDHDGVIIKKSKSGVKEFADNVSFFAKLSHDQRINSDGFTTLEFHTNAESGGQFIKERDYTFVISAEKDGEPYKQLTLTEKLSGRHRFEIDGRIENNSVIGHTDGKVIVRTTTKAKNMQMIFKDSPYENGKPFQVEGEVNGNMVTFEVPSAQHNFMFGSHRVGFSGKSISNDHLFSAVQYYYSKKGNRVKAQRIKQEEGNIFIDIELEHASASQVEVLLNERSFDILEKGEGGKYSGKLNSGDKALEPIFKSKPEVVQLSLSVDGVKMYRYDNIPVKYFDTEQAVKDLEEVKGGLFGSKLKKIKEYLKEKNFEGDIEQMSVLLADELNKDKAERDWSNVWSGAAKLLPKLIGSLIILI
ncbi:hypothetical protein V6R21_03650 [Limibacter armeniacum]|uniref:hypothetical protein n=1 Tax=Limibacter armeniacum TaxID=466084 RepID=UPI002FE6B410